MENYSDLSQISCGPVNSGPRCDPLSSAGLQQAVTSKLPLSGMPRKDRELPSLLYLEVHC